MQYALLSRPNLSDSAETAVRSMIVEGQLPAGERVNEVHLAEHLGVSRTPLREALNRLAAEGALEVRARLGYFVKPLTLEEFDQVYDIRPILDPAALRLAGIPSPENVTRLEKLNRELAQAKSPVEAIAADDAWHRALLAPYPNRVLIAMIETMIVRTRRYELALMRETPSLARPTDEHERIIQALRNNDLDAACTALEANLRSGKAQIVAWLKSRRQ